MAKHDLMLFTINGQIKLIAQFVWKFAEKVGGLRNEQLLENLHGSIFMCLLS